MRKAIQALQTRLAMLALVCVTLVFFTACSDNDGPVAEVTYSWEFKEVSPSTPDFMDDKNKIETVFKTALGASGSATSVTRQGTAEQCDQEVREACQQAFDSLKDEAWQGRYVFAVTNTTTGATICTATFDADDDNIIFDDSDEDTYTASDLKIGDYYYSDGTWSDGGLRKYASNWRGKLYGKGAMEWAEPMPLPESGKTVIGIVFHVGHHYFDQSDYSKSGIGQEKCHGYVVALTNVYNDSDDRLVWESGPNGESNIRVGTSADLDWNGYLNQQKFHDFVNNKANNANGWEMKHFPAALACETYGNRTHDHDGNPITDGRYDWQKPFVAPNGTSGWFLPSCSQLRYLYNIRDFLSQHMDEVKNSIPDGVNSKSYIRGFGTSGYYWSSSEDVRYSGGAWGVYFYSGDSGSASTSSKKISSDVRAVLAF